MAGVPACPGAPAGLPGNCPPGHQNRLPFTVVAAVVVVVVVVLLCLCVVCVLMCLFSPEPLKWGGRAGPRSDALGPRRPWTKAEAPKSMALLSLLLLITIITSTTTTTTTTTTTVIVCMIIIIIIFISTIVIIRRGAPRPRRRRCGSWPGVRDSFCFHVVVITKTNCSWNIHQT